MNTCILRQRSVQAFTACLLAITLILGLTGALTRGAAAQAPALDEPARRPFPRSEALSIEANAEEIPLGEPGLSFRYVQTFGETETAYFEDTNHLNWPTGISTDGNNLWIADGDGRRALKFANDGSFLMQIGKAGFRHTFSETEIVWLFDVGVDSDGNVWLVDAEAAHVIKFDADGNYVSELGKRWTRGPGNDQ